MFTFIFCQNTAIVYIGEEVDYIGIDINMKKAFYAHELPNKTFEAIRNSQPSKEAEELNYLIGGVAQ